MLRRIFPYQAVINHPNKLCLYYHLGLCPCPSVTLDQNYRKNINHIVNFLDGNKDLLLKDLEKERDSASAEDNFEKAGEIQKKIDSIILITSPFYRPFEYEENPNLRSDTVALNLADLKQILNDNGVGATAWKDRMLRISNTSGLNATLRWWFLQTARKIQQLIDGLK